MSKAIFDILNTGRATLLTHQRAIANASNNASNVSTPNYARRELLFTSVSGDEGINVRAYRREFDTYLAAQLLNAESERGATESRTTTLSSVDQLYRESEGGLGATLDSFFNAVRGLSSEPTSRDRRANLLSKGTELTQVISSTAQRLFEERRSADLRLDSMVKQVNEISSALADLNTKISRLPEENAENAALLDRQDQLLRDLSGFVEINTFRAPDNRLTILLQGGDPLVQGEAYATFQATPDPAIDNLRRIDLINISGMALDKTDLISGGKIGGLLTVRDQTLTSLLDRLDNLAYDVATNVNAIHAAGFGLDGLNGRNFFRDPGGSATGYAATMTLDLAVDGNPDAIAASTTLDEAVGGNDNLALWQNLEDQSLAGSLTRTFAQEIADMVGEVGRQGENNRASNERSNVAVDNLSAIRESQVGVSIDEEMIDIMRFQRAYQAGSKIIETVNKMYDIIMDL
jgi:flagellar hook-associated protein 1 FlgK